MAAAGFSGAVDIAAFRAELIQFRLQVLVLKRMVFVAVRDAVAYQVSFPRAVLALRGCLHQAFVIVFSADNIHCVANGTGADFKDAEFFTVGFAVKLLSCQKKLFVWFQRHINAVSRFQERMVSGVKEPVSVLHGLTGDRHKADQLVFRPVHLSGGALYGQRPVKHTPDFGVILIMENQVI